MLDKTHQSEYLKHYCDWFSHYNPDIDRMRNNRQVSDYYDKVGIEKAVFLFRVEHLCPGQHHFHENKINMILWEI